jgi:hypothetical protein
MSPTEHKTNELTLDRKLRTSIFNFACGNGEVIHTLEDKKPGPGSTKIRKRIQELLVSRLVMLENISINLLTVM